MNTTKVMIKGVILTALMEALIESDRQPTEAHIAAVLKFNNELDQFPASTLDRSVIDVFEELIEAVELIPDSAVTEQISLPLVALP